MNWFKGNHFVFTHLPSPRGSPQWHTGSPFFEMDPNSLRLMLKKRVARLWKGLPSNAAGAQWLFALRIFHQITVPQRVFVKVGGEMQSYDLRIWWKTAYIIIHSHIHLHFPLVIKLLWEIIYTLAFLMGISSTILKIFHCNVYCNYQRVSSMYFTMCSNLQMYWYIHACLQHCSFASLICVINIRTQCFASQGKFIGAYLDQLQFDDQKLQPSWILARRFAASALDDDRWSWRYWRSWRSWRS